MKFYKMNNISDTCFDIRIKKIKIRINEEI